MQEAMAAAAGIIKPFLISFSFNDRLNSINLFLAKREEVKKKREEKNG